MKMRFTEEQIIGILKEAQERQQKEPEKKELLRTGTRLADISKANALLREKLGVK